MSTRGPVRGALFDRADAREFLPALERLQQTPPSPLGRCVLWSVFALGAVVVGWAAVCELDIVAVARGKLIPADYVKIVQPAEQGVVKDILVREGDEVEQGQLLIRMDAVLSDSEGRTLAADRDLKRLSLRRIESELSGRPFDRRPGDAARLHEQVAQQHAANLAAYRSALAQEQALVERARFELAAAEALKEKLLAVLPHYREQEEAFEKLSRGGYAGRLLLVDKQRERIEKERDLQSQEHIIQASRAAIAQAEQRERQIAADYQRALQRERVEVTAQLERSEEELQRQQHRRLQLELKAPQDGIVKDLATHTPGTVVAPGAILMTLVPRDRALRAEVWLSNDDIGFVFPTQPVKLKVDAFEFQKYGMLEGIVARISPDATDGPAAPGSADPGTSGGLAYRTVVDLQGHSLQSGGRELRLAPGMRVTAEVLLGRRTVLEYLTSPILRAWHEAARER